MFQTACTLWKNILSVLSVWLITATVQSGTDATLRYYNTYISYGSGDTIIQTYQQHKGPQDANRKWNIECLDGEAMVGICDFTDDFQFIQQFWCKFRFGYKSAANQYPYYGGCHIRNYTKEFFCFNAQDAAKTVNTFIVASWSTSLTWSIHNRDTTIPDNNPYKCCQTPSGYYIDYISCYFQVTHDHFFEYYDNNNIFLVACATGYIMTGIAKKLSFYDKEYHIDWIQCCRLGFGPSVAQSPPLTTNPADGGMSLYSHRSVAPPYSQITEGFRSQYRTVRNAFGDEGDADFVNRTLGSVGENGLDAHTAAYMKKKAGERKRKRAETNEYDRLVSLEALDEPLSKFSGQNDASH